MANALATTIRSELGVSRPVRKTGGGWPGTITGNVTNKDAMILFLNGTSPTTYTIPRLLNMTGNDMVFAIRTIYDASGI